MRLRRTRLDSRCKRSLLQLSYFWLLNESNTSFSESFSSMIGHANEQVISMKNDKSCCNQYASILLLYTNGFIQLTLFIIIFRHHKGVMTTCRAEQNLKKSKNEQREKCSSFLILLTSVHYTSNWQETEKKRTEGRKTQ